MVVSGRALVLGGGGSVGHAWEIGVVAGLLEAGLDVTEADLVIGTSAGATAAAQVSSARPEQLFAAIVTAAPHAPAGRVGTPAGSAPHALVSDHLVRTNRIIAVSEGAADMRRRMGAAALELDPTADGSRRTRWRATVAARLPSQSWPTRRMLVTAVDARTGEPVVFDRDSGIDLVDAVAASTSSGAAYGVGDDRYIDGGYRRNENADLATGCERVLVLSPLGGRSRHPPEWRMQLAAQVDELRASGSRVETLLPDGPALEAFGVDLMDLSRRPAAARAGYDQGTARAEQLAELWG